MNGKLRIDNNIIIITTTIYYVCAFQDEIHGLARNFNTTNSIEIFSLCSSVRAFSSVLYQILIWLCTIYVVYRIQK